MEKRIHKTLYTNVKLQDWLQDHEATKLRWFRGNIYMMKPNSSINKVMLDTDRNRFVPDIIDKYYFRYKDDSQKAFWESTKYYYGNELELIKSTSEADVYICFSTENRYIIKVRPASTYKKSRFLEKFSLTEDRVIDGTILITETGNYNIDNAFDDIKTRYLDVIQEVIDE